MSGPYAPIAPPVVFLLPDLVSPAFEDSFVGLPDVGMPLAAEDDGVSIPSPPSPDESVIIIPFGRDPGIILDEGRPPPPVVPADAYEVTGGARSGLFVRPGIQSDLVAVARAAIQREPSLPNQRLVLEAYELPVAWTPWLEGGLRALAEGSGITIALKYRTEDGPAAVEIEPAAYIAEQMRKGALAAMPGLGLGMGLHLTQQVHLRLTLQLPLGVDAFRTSIDEKVREQRGILEKLMADLQGGVYADWANFHDRCMKRIKKGKRTEAVRELIGTLRTVVGEAKPTLGDIREVLEIGLKAADTRQVPSEVLQHLGAVLQAPPMKALNDPARLIRVGGVLRQGDADLTDVFGFLDREAADGRFENPVLFGALLDKVQEMAPEDAPALKAIAEHFDGLTSGLAIDAPAMGRAFVYLQQLHELATDGIEEDEVQEGRRFLGDARRLERWAGRLVPWPIAAELAESGVEEATLARAEALFGQDHLQRSRDARRRWFRGLDALDGDSQRAQVLAHLLALVTSSELAGKILGQLSLLRRAGDFTYFFDATEGRGLLERLESYATAKYLKALGFDDAAMALYAPSIHLLHAGNLLTILTTYGGIIASSYSDGLALLREIAQHLMEGDFPDWRYGGDVVERQLRAVFASEGTFPSAVKAWRANAQSERRVGDSQGPESVLQAVRMRGADMRQHYRAVTGFEVSADTLAEARQKVAEIEAEFRAGTVQDKKGMGQIKKALQDVVLMLTAILDVSEARVDTLDAVRAGVGKIADKIGDPELRAAFADVLRLLDSPVIQGMERVRVRETDDPAELFNVGVRPMQSCQRWTEPTGYNRCLMAYVADGNKKLFQVLDAKGNVLVRSIVRLLPFPSAEGEGVVPMLFIERPYAMRWSRDYGRALVAQVAQRALELSEAVQGPVALATNDPQIREVLQDFVKQYKMRMGRKKYRQALPASRNGHEYSDSLGGDLASGASVETELSYLFIVDERYGSGVSADGDAGSEEED